MISKLYIIIPFINQIEIPMDNKFGELNNYGVMKIVSQAGYFTMTESSREAFKAQEQLMVSQHLRLLGAIKRPV